MWELLALILGTGSIFLWLQKRVMLGILEDIIATIQNEKSILLEKKPFLPFDFPFSKFQKVLDENRKKILKLENQSNQRVNEFNETLGGMLDGALLLDLNHIIIFSNHSADNSFGDGKSLQGRRLEAIVDSFQILEMINKMKTGRKPGKTEFIFHKDGLRHDFEATGAIIADLQEERNEVILLLLREVTEIKRVERMQKDFVANASHELRTPITMIRGFSDSLVDHEDLSDEQIEKFISKIHKNTLRLQALIDDLLSLSELEGSERALNLTDNKLSETIRGVDHYLSEKSYVYPEKLFFDFAKEDDPFPFDPVKIAVAISNLIDNAFKYGGDFSFVRVKTEISENGQWISCSVTDDGIGIKEKDLNRIFERFYVVDKGRSREKGGTGLGLSIVRHIAESHGGKIEAKSTPSVSTTFTITLPRFKIDPPHPQH